MHETITENIAKVQQENELYYKIFRTPIYISKLSDYALIKNVDVTTEYNKLIPKFKRRFIRNILERNRILAGDIGGL